MKKEVKGLVAGLIIGATLTSGVVFAKQATEKIEIIYDNIKILIDGKEYQPDDGNGNPVEPFIYNGTTYLPVRAVANAFDKEVDWEPQTSSVILGTKDYDWLDQMGYADYETSSSQNTMTSIASKTKATDGMIYDRGLNFYLDLYYGYIKELNDGTKLCYQEVSYLLNNNYKSFNGTLCTLRADDAQPTIVKMYGDGKLIYTSPTMSYGTKSTPFDIDVSGYKLLKIKVEVPNISKSYGSRIYVGLADARLSKK